MGEFRSRLILAPMDDGVHWVVWLPFYYQDDELGLITVPEGMITDGGSIPKLFTNIIPPLGKGLKAFVVHDALYTYKWFTRDQSDRCLWRMLKELGEPGLEANIIYDAVHLGGGSHWDQKENTNGPNLSAVNGL